MTGDAIPLWLKLAYSLFLAVLVPVYWRDYGPSNFLYFCDVALFLALLAIWTENPIFASAAAVGILVPQLAWMVDFLCGMVGWFPIGATKYMYDSKLSLFTRGLSFFHFWLPILLMWMVWKLGYDSRGLMLWVALAAVILPVCYFLMPGPTDAVAHADVPKNINYVFGFDSNKPQTMMSAPAWFGTLCIVLLLVVYLPTHLVLNKTLAKTSTIRNIGSAAAVHHADSSTARQSASDG